MLAVVGMLTSALTPANGHFVPGKHSKTTALDDYVNKPDDAYHWFETGVTFEDTLTNAGGEECKYTARVLNMTSQTWLTEDDFAEGSKHYHTWWHFLTVIIPENVDYANGGMMWITGGSNNGANTNPAGPDTDDIQIPGRIACNTRTVAVSLFQIPNQPVRFADDPRQQNRYEDAIIAFTWRKFIEDTSRPEWLLRLPMTKAAVRALDTVTSFISQRDGAEDWAERFVVAGGSKRGWTTWTLGAVDSRVKGMVPIVMDLVNTFENIEHHYRAYGGWSFVLQDYVQENFTSFFRTPEAQLLADIVDPYSYFDRYTMDKFIINGPMDEFFQPDDSLWWYSDLPEPKHFYMVPNAEHSMATGIPRVVPALTAWIKGHLKNQRAPKFSWTIDGCADPLEDCDRSGDLRVYSEEKPSRVQLWKSTTSQSSGRRRDWRAANYNGRPGNPECPWLDANGICLNLAVLFRSEDLNETEAGSQEYSIHVDAPAGEARWTAFYANVHFPGPSPEDAYNPDFSFTTEVSIIPTRYPWPKCTDEPGPDNCQNAPLV